MGWSNYLVFGKEKVAFELSKSISYLKEGEIEEDVSSLNRIMDLVANDDTGGKEARKISLQDMCHILEVYFEAVTLDESLYEHLFIYWFMIRGYGDWVIMHEDDFKKVVTSDYKIFEARWDEDSLESME